MTTLASARGCGPVTPVLLLVSAAVATLMPGAVMAQSTSPVVHPIGRMHLDAASYHGAEEALSNGTDLRRVRVGLEGTLGERSLFQLEMDLGEGEVEIKDAWIAHRLTPELLLRAGAFKEPFSLEELTSSRFITFMERALVNELAPGRSLGVSATIAHPGWWASAGLFGQDADDRGDADLAEAEGWAVTGRAVVRRWSPSGDGIQLGASATRRTPNAREGGGDRVRFRTYPEARVDRSRFLNTGHIRGVLHHRAVGVEALGVWGPIAVQAERMNTTVVRAPERGGDVALGGSYLSARVFLVGEGRVYDPASAELGAVAVGAEGRALEFAVRYSHLDLNDADAGVEGGEATNWTAGLTWHLSSRVQWMVNHVWADHGPLADGDGDFIADDDFRILETRLQFWF